MGGGKAQMSERLAAGGETPPPGAGGQRQQQEEDPAHNENRSGTADARGRPGEPVGERHRGLTGQQGQYGLVEEQQGQEHQEAWGGGTKRPLASAHLQAAPASPHLTG